MTYTDKDFGQLLQKLVDVVAERNLKNKTMIYLADFAEASVTNNTGEMRAYPTLLRVQHAGLPLIQIMFYEANGCIECSLKYYVDCTEGNIVFPKTWINAENVNEAFDKALHAVGAIPFVKAYINS